MHMESLERWQHKHVFGQDEKKQGERRTLFVIVLTSAMMVLEIVAGLHYGSMALLADGLHMASHAAALGIKARLPTSTLVAMPTMNSTLLARVKSMHLAVFGRYSAGILCHLHGVGER